MSAKEEVGTLSRMLTCWCCGNLKSQCVGELTTDAGIGWCKACREGAHRGHMFLRDTGKTLYDVYLNCVACKVTELEVMERWEVDALLFSPSVGLDACYSCQGNRTIVGAHRKGQQLVLDQPAVEKPVEKPEPLLAACYRGAT